MSKIIRKFLAVILAGVLGITAAYIISATNAQAAEEPEQEGENLLVNPDWENGLDGWVILADSLKESVGDHEVLYSIVYQDIPVEEYMKGKAVKLSGSIATAADDPTQESMILTILICGEDGYVLDDTDEEGYFIYDAYAQEEQPVPTYHEKVMDIPEEASFIRISMEIWKQGTDNFFNFSDLKLELVEKETAGSPFVRVTGSENETAGAFTRTGTDEQPTAKPETDTQAETTIVLPAETQEDVPVYTFTGRNDAEYSAPVNLFAAGVIEYSTGSAWTSYENDMDPENVLGLPDYDDDAVTGEYCMGAGGELVLEFDRGLCDGPGADIYVFEIGSGQGGQNEDVMVEVSNDLVTWYNIGTTSAYDLSVDMNGSVPAGSSFKYVRITDISHTGGGWPGADLDAVCGFYGEDISQTGSIPSQSQPEVQSADADDPQIKALVEKGKGYYYGTGEEGYDRAKARQCFYDAADAHSGEGWYYFGNMLMNSIEDQRYKRAMGCYERACYYGYDLGLVGQAVLYENGLGTETDYTKAYELYQQAVDAGFAEGYCGLGGLYQYGNGVKQDELVAMEYYKMALESRDFMWRNFARCQIAKMYLNGAPGISQDYIAAYDWFKQAADEGYGAGYLGIGNMYYSGNGLDQNRAVAYLWFEQAADHGNVAAMFNVGYMSEQGEGTGKDPYEAFKYFLMAANAGDADAMYTVGCMYEEGKGTDKDYSQARTWLELAIEFAGDDMELKEMAGEELTWISSEESVGEYDYTYISYNQDGTIDYEHSY